jgi:hypothetical protein
MTVSGLNGVGDGGVVAKIGAGAAFAAESLITMTVVPVTVTPPLAVPFSTGLVSVTEVFLPPWLRSVAMRTCATSLFGATTELNRPESLPGIVTATRPLSCATDDPGM